MADAVKLPGVLEQIRLVSALRWRILRNNLRNQNRRWDAIGLAISSTLMGVFVTGMCLAFYAGMAVFLKYHRVNMISLLFWGIFVWWQLIPIVVAGFSPEFSFRALLRFPLKFPAFYLIAIAYGFADSAAVASLLWLASMCLATAVVKTSLLPVMLAACALFAGVNVTLERLLGSWMEKILAQRRSRELFFALFLLLSVGLQFIGPAVNKYGHSARPAVLKMFPYFKVLPPSLAGRAATGWALGDRKEILTAFAGLAVYGFIFGGLLWSRFAAQYRGEELSETAAPARASKKEAKAAAMTADGRETGILPAAVSAMVRKELRYLTRNMFAFVSLLYPPFLVLLFSTQFAGPHPTAARHGVSPDFFFPGMMAWIVLMLMAPAYNCFAFESRGMQTYFMVPVRFRDVLLGKNLTQASILGAEMLLCIGMLAWRVGLPPLPVFFSTIAAVVFSVVGQFTLANWSSLSFPKKMEFGKMHGQRNSGMAVLIAFAAQLLFGGVAAAVLFAGRWMGNPWLAGEVFVFLAAASLGGYFVSLDALTKLAEKKKEVLLQEMGK